MNLNLFKVSVALRSLVLFYIVILPFCFLAGIALADQPAGVSFNPSTGVPSARPSPAPPFSSASLIIRHQNLSQGVITNFPYLTSALLQSNSIPSNDSIAKRLLSQIELTKHQLQSTNIPPVMRRMLENDLGDFQYRLDQHLKVMKVWQEAAAELQANPKLARSNIMEIRPDPIVMSMSDMEAHFQRETDDTNLPLNVRQANERIVATLQGEIQDHEKDASLWANLHDAELSGNQTQIAEAKQSLATHLAAKLGVMQKKSYPTNMSLEAVMAIYNNQTGLRWSRSDTIRSVVLAVLVAPLLVMAFLVIKKLAFKG